MPHVIAAPCVADFSCVEVCPVDCISPAPEDEDFERTDQLFINPEICVDCGACVDVCPVLAIFEQSSLPQKWSHYADVNRAYFREKESV